jgi:hypothetical protein
MAEQKKRGFHALEQRIHQLEEEDAKQQASSGERRADAPQGQPSEKGTVAPKKK